VCQEKRDTDRPEGWHWLFSGLAGTRQGRKMTGRLAELVRAVDQADDDRRAVASVPEVLRQPGAAHAALAAEREAETER